MSCFIRVFLVASPPFLANSRSFLLLIFSSFCYNYNAHSEDRATLRSDPSAVVSDLRMGGRAFSSAFLLSHSQQISISVGQMCCHWMPQSITGGKDTSFLRIKFYPFFIAHMEIGFLLQRPFSSTKINFSSVIGRFLKYSANALPASLLNIPFGFFPFLTLIWI